MRLPLARLFLASFLCFACAPESAPPATSVAPVARNRAPAVASMPALPAPEAAKPEPTTAAPAKRAPRALPKATVASGTLDTAKLGSRGLLHWLPEDALLVLRVPHVESLGEIRRRTTVGALLQNPGVMMALCAPDGPIGQLTAKIHSELPELEALLAKLPGLKGDLVLGLAHAEVGAGAPKATAVLAFDAGADADELQKALDPLLARLQGLCADECARPEDGWGLRGWHDEACFEIRRFGNVFTVLCGNDPQFAGGIRPASEGPSFAGAALVASARDLNGAAKGVFECYLNTDPAWKLVEESAPAEARSVLEKLGLYDVHGLALGLALGEKGMAEAHTWSAPGHGDVVSRVLAGAPAERELGRWIPADATTAGLYQFDLAELFDAIVALLPEAERAEFERELEQCQETTGIDVVADVVHNLGPSYAMVSRGDALGLANGPAGVCLVVETHDDDQTSLLIGKLIPLLPPSLQRRTSELAGRSILSLDLTPLGMPLTALIVCRVDGALILATDEKLLERCLVAGKEPGVKQPALAAALAGEGVIGAALSAPVGDLPATLTVVRKTASGIEVSSPDGSGALGTAFVTVVPVVAAIAIPRLMAERAKATQKRSPR